MPQQNRIDRVTVYRSGATITRTVRVTPAGPEVEVTGLPLALLDDTVRVRVLTDGVRAGAPHVGLHATPPDDLPDMPEEEAVLALRRDVQRAELRLDLLAVEITVLQALEVPDRPRMPKGLPPPPSPTPARLALERFTHTAIESRLDESRILREQLRTQREDLSAAEERARRAGTAHLADRQTVSKALRIPLHGASGPVDLEVDYHVPGARWAPVYACHVDPISSEVTLQRRAVVAQGTGEDWERVKLSLSTALPHRFARLPELSSRRIGKRQPPRPARGQRPPPQPTETLFADFDQRPRRRRPIDRRTPDLTLLPAPAAIRAALPPVPVPYGGAAEDLDDEGGLEAQKESASAVSRPVPPNARPMSSALGRSAGAAPMAPPAPSKPAKAKRSRPGQPSRKESAPEPPAPSSFGQLRLAAPDSPQRGRLLPASPLDEYRASLAARGLTLDTDVARLVRAAEERSQAVAGLSLPAGTQALDQGAFDHTLLADHPVDVPSSGRFHGIRLTSLTTTADLTYVVVPRLDTSVYRVAALSNPSDAPLLPGPVEVHVGARFVLTGALPLVAPRGTFTLGLGVEQGIRCARNTQYREARSGTAVVAMNELHHTLTITLANGLARPIRAEVRERIPVPAPDAEVAVEEVEVSPAWEPWDQRTVGGAPLEGGRVWRCTVEAGGEAELTAHYVVQIYANNAIVGGNRREA